MDEEKINPTTAQHTTVHLMERILKPLELFVTAMWEVWIKKHDPEAEKIQQVYAAVDEVIEKKLDELQFKRAGPEVRMFILAAMLFSMIESCKKFIEARRWPDEEVPLKDLWKEKFGNGRQEKDEV